MCWPALSEPQWWNDPVVSVTLGVSWAARCVTPCRDSPLSPATSSCPTVREDSFPPTRAAAGPPVQTSRQLHPSWLTPTRPWQTGNNITIVLKLRFVLFCTLVHIKSSLCCPPFLPDFYYHESDSITRYHIKLIQLNYCNTKKISSRFYLSWNS